MATIATETQVLYPEATRADIDFFKIPEDKLKAHGFTVEKKEIELSTIQRISRAFLEDNGLEPDKRETVVFNLPTNAGKSTTAYELIQHYYREKGNLVIVCSPFIKLVEKDVRELTDVWSVPVFNYKELVKPTVNLEEALSMNVQVMTVNCLLANGGGNIDQSAQKLEYVSRLRERAEKENLNVVLFFDEIHESVQNFDSRQLPYLALWRNRIKKIYVSSATHTTSSYAIIKYLGRMTGGVIHIFESDRTRVNPLPAALTIHITEQRYTKDDFTGLNLLLPILKASDGKWVNILVAQKGLADNLKKDKESPFYELLKDYNLVTGDTQNEFAFDKNNIGTTFKTGVNICGKDNVFIVILPNPGYADASASLNDNNIFSDGAPSIIQALGRQREGGTCHIIMGRPWQHIIGTKLVDEYHKPVQLYKYRAEVYKDQNALLDVIISDYHAKMKTLHDAIRFLGTDCLESNVQGVTAHYPTLQEYLLHPGQLRLAKTELSAGQGLYPYLLWAAVNNQFGNVNLKSVYQHKRAQVELVLGADYDVNVDSLTNLFPDLYFSNNICVPEVFDVIYRELFVTAKENKLVIQTIGDETLEAKDASQLTRRTLFLTTIRAVGAGSSFPIEVQKNGRNISFEKWYLRCMLDGHYKKAKTPELKQAYDRLYESREQYYAFIENTEGATVKHNGKLYLTHLESIPDIFPKDQAENLLAALSSVIEKDSFFINDVGAITITQCRTDSDVKRKAFDLGRQLFTILDNLKRADGQSVKSRVPINGIRVNLFVVYDDWKFSKLHNDTSVLITKGA
jgi:hypothetical protein